MLTSAQSAGGVTAEVNLSTQARKPASEKSTLALKPTEDVTRSPKQGYQWPHEKDLCPSKIKKTNLQSVIKTFNIYKLANQSIYLLSHF